MTVSNDKQIRDMENTLLLAKMLGAKWFGISSVIKHGRAENNRLSEASSIIISKTVEKLSKTYPKFFVGNPLEYLPLEDSETSKPKHCGAGRNAIAVSVNNRITPCSLCGENFEIFGKLANDNIMEIFKSDDYQTFSTLNPPSIETCKSCEHMVFCLGCMIRGLNKAREIGMANCNWILKESEYTKKSLLFNKINKN
jgi:radical SAM protein with 4Fe4S-binding SPASM domain